MLTKWAKKLSHAFFFCCFLFFSCGACGFMFTQTTIMNKSSKQIIPLFLFWSSAVTSVWNWKCFFVPSLPWHQQCYFHTLSYRPFFCITRYVLTTELLVLLHSSQETGTATVGLAVKQEFSVNCPSNHRCCLKLRYSWIRTGHSVAKMPLKWMGRGKW